jgi:hypothetical protein
MRTAKFTINIFRNHESSLRTGNNKQIPALRCGACPISCALIVGQEVHVQYSVLTLICPSSFCRWVCVPLSSPLEHCTLSLHVFSCWLTTGDNSKTRCKKDGYTFPYSYPEKSTIMLTSTGINQPEPPKSNMRWMTIGYIWLVKNPSTVV